MSFKNVTEESLASRLPDSILGGFRWESEDLGDPEQPENHGDPEQPEDPEKFDHLKHPEHPEEPTSGDTSDQCEALSGQSPRHQEGSW